MCYIVFLLNPRKLVPTKIKPSTVTEEKVSQTSQKIEVDLYYVNKNSYSKVNISRANEIEILAKSSQ